MPSKVGANKGLRESPEKAKIRVLLTLWQMELTEKEIKSGRLKGRIVRTGEKRGDYKPLLDELEATGAIAIDNNNVSMTPVGVGMLEAGLKGGEFRFDSTVVGAKIANALLDWIQQSSGSLAGAKPATGEAIAKRLSKIASYEEFEEAILETYDRLNRDYNLDDLVPIYRLRREIGDRVSRSQFNDWLLEVQANDILQLMGGSLPDNDPSKLEDSVSTEMSGLRCYAKRLI
ncbi:MAG: hypothetical protein F6J93_28230 [Oscillatoria sp. SIO1A7]|nr:hypothetical protein [Oscillatoria sp. SIO1A7]